MDGQEYPPSPNAEPTSPVERVREHSSSPQSNRSQRIRRSPTSGNSLSPEARSRRLSYPSQEYPPSPNAEPTSPLPRRSEHSISPQDNRSQPSRRSPRSGNFSSPDASPRRPNNPSPPRRSRWEGTRLARRGNPNFRRRSPNV